MSDKYSRVIFAILLCILFTSLPLSGTAQNAQPVYLVVYRTIGPAPPYQGENYDRGPKWIRVTPRPECPQWVDPRQYRNWLSWDPGYAGDGNTPLIACIEVAQKSIVDEQFQVEARARNTLSQNLTAEFQRQINEEYVTRIPAQIKDAIDSLPGRVLSNPVVAEIEKRVEARFEARLKRLEAKLDEALQKRNP